MSTVEEAHVNETLGEACNSRANSQVFTAEVERNRDRPATKTRKSAETRSRIMDIASQIMVERGNTAFQMSEVSNRCRMSKGTLYYYFSDKSDLVNAIFGAKIESFVTDIESVIDQEKGPLEKVFLAVNEEFVRRMSEDAILAMAMMWELVGLHEGSSSNDDGRVLHIVDTVADLLESAKEAGIVRTDIEGRRGVAMICGALTFGALCPMDSDKQDEGFPNLAFDILAKGFNDRG